MNAGRLYQQTRDLDIAQVAKLVRRDIKTAQTDGKNPVPADATIRVRIDRYSMGQSIDIYVEGMPDTWIYTSLEPDPDYRDGRPRRHGNYSTACAAATEELTRILAAYNRDNSDSMTDYYDVRFAGDVKIRDERSTGA